MKLCLVVFALLSELFSVCQSLTEAEYRVHVMQPGAVIRNNGNQPQLGIYCYSGRKKQIIHFFETVKMTLDINLDQYEQYKGFTPQEVIQEFELNHYSWSFNIFSWKTDAIELQPFNRSCIGIYNINKYQVYNIELAVIRVDFWRVLMLVLGLLMLFSAPKLCQNPLFYYICGITLGISASFLLLIYMISKLLPQKPMMYGFIVGGWTVCVYLIQLIWGNLHLIAQQYYSHVMAYMACTGLVSFVVCYRFGPVTNPRSKNLIKWALQVAGLALIFFCTHYREAASAFIMALLAGYNFPASWFSSFQIAWMRRFPPKAKLMTEEEYHEQGFVETKRALEDLRGYCSSPECDAWKTMLKLKDPMRFASFMDGVSHISDDEVLEYETDSTRNLNDCYTYDESDENE